MDDKTRIAKMIKNWKFTDGGFDKLAQKLLDSGLSFQPRGEVKWPEKQAEYNSEHSDFGNGMTCGENKMRSNCIKAFTEWWKGER